MTYLHILNGAGERLALINTRQRLDPAEMSKLVAGHRNPGFDKEKAAHDAYLALPGKPDHYSTRRPPEPFRGVGVLSSHADLKALPRFDGSGAIKAEHIPTQLRGQALVDYLDSLTRVTPPPIKGGNLKPAWTAGTAPRKARSLTADQLTHASKLRGQGVAWQKVARIVGAAKSSLMDAMRNSGPAMGGGVALA